MLKWFQQKREVNQIICPTQIPLVRAVKRRNELLMEEMRRNSQTWSWSESEVHYLKGLVNSKEIIKTHKSHFSDEREGIF